MISKIKWYFRRKKFEKRCPDYACPSCPYYAYDCKCRLAIELGLEEV